MTLTLTELAAQLSEESGALVEAHPYDVGYWARVVGMGLRELPCDRGVRNGYRQADRELKREQKCLLT